MTRPGRALRVLWIGHMIPWPPKGGNVQRSFNLLRQASKRHSVFLAALNQRAILPTREAISEAVAELGRFCDDVRVCEIPSNRSPLLWSALIAASVVTPQPYAANWLRSRALRSILADLRSSHHFDLVHLDTVALHQYAAGFEATPTVLTHHNVESDMMEKRAAREANPLKRWFFSLQSERLANLERVAASRCAVNLVVSDLDSDRVRRIVPGCATEIVPNGVDVDYFQAAPGANSPPRSLVFIGGMSWYPNRDAMLFFVREVWPRLVAAHPDWKAAIVGQNPPPDVLRAVGERFEAPGFVDDPRPYFDAAAIYLCPITAGGGTRLKILDALAMGKPLVATKFAVEGLGLVENQHYLRAEGADEFVAGLERLAGDAALRGHLSRNARRLVVERFSWGVVGERLDRAYRRAVAGVVEG